MNPTRKTLLFTAASLTLVSTACSGQASDEAPAAEPSTAASAAPQSAAPQSAAPQSGEPAGSYADGEYSAQGTYTPPSNTTEEVDVTLTLEGGVVTALEVTASGNHPTSKQYQREFTSGVQEEVVGKNLDELDVDKIAGSSLTSSGFNKALESIRTEAAN
ncbi:FMN-binding protein [Arthrobacter sp. zg-Y820]|uniref:FMN-binding protein n=1 Tax=unclassified Arthrobacter TaxID=235627 RepID=UPI001E2B34C5|nr:MULTISPECIES: FMN-binding protein [unclassified Arthrobacter]MCC9196078.1 FMN-binding protein [Arthrobacter sp. zg-Y820]MDK1278937.1 FMN-binding protein [Arthrobacter sp. zg.Y820]WIB08650.1 FMN-binding protein [Arthrobacter sp. zg-Y820]